MSRKPYGPQYSKQVLEWLDERSNRNMINFYKDELKHIEKHGKRPKGLTPQQMNRLMQNGLLSTYRDNGFLRYRLTVLALACMEAEK